MVGLAAGLALLHLLLWGLTWQAIATIPVLVALAVVVVSDLVARTIPDLVTLPGLAYGLVVSLALGERGLGYIALGVLVGGGVPLAMSIVSSGGVGGGDIKLLAMLGGVFGWQGVLLILVLSQFVALAFVVGVSLARRRFVRDAIPVGAIIAAIAAAFLVVHCCGAWQDAA